MRLAAFKGLGTASNYRHPEAQETLIRLARSKSLPVADRVAAVEGLTKTLKLMLPGNFEDRNIVWAVVLLLDDDEQKVREAAFAPLQTWLKELFDYKPDLPTGDRKQAVAKWKAWCTKVAGPMEGGPAKP